MLADRVSALSGGALVMGQALAAGPAAVTQQVDSPSSSQHDATDDRVSGVDDGASRASDAAGGGGGPDSTRDQAERGGN